MKFRAGTDEADAVRGHGLALGRAGLKGAFRVVHGARGSARALAARLAADPRVEFAEPNWIRHVDVIDGRLWAFRNPGGLNMAFSDGGGPTGASYASKADADEHAIEGIASGGGAAGNVTVFVQRVCGTNGCYTASIVNASYAAADYPGMVAMNLSLGGGTESTAEKDTIACAANTTGVLVIASAGNSGTSRVGCPACDPNAISVASTNWPDQLASYSQYGMGLDIAAPGGQCYSNTTEEGSVFSAIVAGYTAGRAYAVNGASYAYMQGTSMAAPQVTGAAAVVASKTGQRGSALRTRLERSTDDLGSAGYDTRFGDGRLNVYRAVTGGTDGDDGGRADGRAPRFRSRRARA